MASCKDCIHYEACEDWAIEYGDNFFPFNNCQVFKPKYRYIELPCSVGDTVYRIWSVGKHGKSVAEFVITSISQIASGVWVIKYQKPSTSLMQTPTRYQCNLEDIGKTVFLTKEEAEAELLKRGKENA